MTQAESLYGKQGPRHYFLRMKLLSWRVKLKCVWQLLYTITHSKEEMYIYRVLRSPPPTPQKKKKKLAASFLIIMLSDNNSFTAWDKGKKDINKVLLNRQYIVLWNCLSSVPLSNSVKRKPVARMRNPFYRR